MNKLKWFYNRLKSMSVVEIPYRAKQLIQKQYEKQISKAKLPLIKRQVATQRLLNLEGLEFEKYPSFISVFGREFDYSNGEIDWHTDIFSGESFPLSFSKSINIRSHANLSAKNVWEINRLQFLPFLAINYKITGDEKYLNHFISIIESWIENNPYLLGVNWYSNIEVNLRLISWFFCWEILDVEALCKDNVNFNKFVEKKWLPSVHQHCQYSYANPSKYSSSNNHLISEYAGLFIAGSLWQFKESAKWTSYAKKGMEKEILRQYSKNGVNKEEAAEYIQFITDFFLLALVVGENSGNSFSEEYKARFKEILYYIHDFLDCRGNFPQYGDEDDGKCFILNAKHDFNNFKSLLTSGTILFQDSALKDKSNGFDAKNAILFGKEGQLAFNDIPSRKKEEQTVFYKEEGHFILKKQDEEKEVYIHFDAAALGYLSIAAHGHADALSFILHIDGQPVFVDSGTYTYHTEQEWRNYFMGTMAHNTIRINKKDQASIAGPTLWLNHYQTKVIVAESNEDFDRVKAQHNGYRKMGINHTREICFDKKELIIKIVDTIESTNKNNYFIELPFHLHPDMVVLSLGQNQFEICNPKGRSAIIQVDQKLNTHVVNGQIVPEILGWYSASFTQKKACTTLLNCTSGTGSTSFETLILII
ncbi:MAG: alginate lyase family protein [Bacteroidales bacterium]|nr:alginate lyase family protein [Bacteroidales bacterium]